MNVELRDAAFRAGVWAVIEARAKAMKDQAKAELAQLEPGDTVAGKWHGQTVAKATMTTGRSKVEVTDTQALLDWVKREHPTEVVEAVNPAYVKSLEIYNGHVIDKQGVVVPGVQVVQGDPSITVRKADGAEEIIAELFRTGSVALDGIKPAPLPALEAS